MISFSVQLPDIPGSVQKMLPTQNDMRDVAMRARRVILERTASGMNANGEPFVPYSPMYYQRKEKSGRRPDPVSLMWDNTMLASISVRDITNGSELFFASAEMQLRAMRHHFGLERMPMRPFFALSEAEFNDIMSRLFQKMTGRFAW